MAYFQDQNPSLGKLWRVLQWKLLVYFKAICCILLLFGIFPPFGMLYSEKSGITAPEQLPKKQSHSLGWND
jgi:hypothetical protein